MLLWLGEPEIEHKKLQTRVFLQHEGAMITSSSVLYGGLSKGPMLWRWKFRTQKSQKRRAVGALLRRGHAWLRVVCTEKWGENSPVAAFAQWCVRKFAAQGHFLRIPFQNVRRILCSYSYNVLIIGMSNPKAWILQSTCLCAFFSPNTTLRTTHYGLCRAKSWPDRCLTKLDARFGPEKENLTKTRLTTHGFSFTQEVAPDSHLPNWHALDGISLTSRSCKVFAIPVKTQNGIIRESDANSKELSSPNKTNGVINQLFDTQSLRQSLPINS